MRTGVFLSIYFWNWNLNSWSTLGALDILGCFLWPMLSLLWRRGVTQIRGFRACSVRSYIHSVPGHDHTYISWSWSYTHFIAWAKSAPRRLSTRERRLPEEKSESSEKESVCARFRGPAPPACTPSGFWVSSAEPVKVKTWRGLVWMATACWFERERGYYKEEPWILNLTILS